LLRQFTPNQLWSAENDLVSKAIEQVHHNPSKFDVAAFSLKLDKPNLHYRRIFWSRATILEQDKQAGNLQGKSQAGDWRCIGVAKNGVGFKVLNINNMKTKEVATARFNEETDDIQDKLTGLDRNGGVDALSDPDLGDRIKGSWDLSSEQDIRSPLGDLQAMAIPGLDGDVEGQNLSSSSDESEEEARGPTDDPILRPTTRPSSTQADYSGDLSLLNDTQRVKLPRKTGLDDGELRTLKKRTQRLRVKKRSHQSHETEPRSILDNAQEAPDESDNDYLRRYHAANLPISFVRLNPKRKGSKSWTYYGQFKSAKTIQEALRLGASWSRIQDDYSKGYLRTHPAAELKRLNAVVQVIFNTEDYGLPTASEIDLEEEFTS
jgi:hypothetical protein